VWLPIVDTYRTLCIAPTPEVRALFESMSTGARTLEAVNKPRPKRAVVDDGACKTDYMT
jgi:hypothetical protein